MRLEKHSNRLGVIVLWKCFVLPPDNLDGAIGVILMYSNGDNVFNHVLNSNAGSLLAPRYCLLCLHLT